LDQATSRLGLQSAARRLYTNDGTAILDLDDLVAWVREEYVREARVQMRREAKAKRFARMQQNQESGCEFSHSSKMVELSFADTPKLMDKVQLDSDFSEDEEEEEEDERKTEVREVEERECSTYLDSAFIFKHEFIHQMRWLVIMPRMLDRSLTLPAGGM
jgi:hypothetical protein